MRTPTPLKDYLERTLGNEVELRPACVGDLPVYLVHAYDLWRTKLFAREFLLAEARDDHDEPRARLAADVAALRRAAPDAHVALVLPRLASLQRSRLVAAGVPFIVPGRQMYLPTVLVDLREHFPRARMARPKRLSAAAQLVVLRHLLWRDVEGRTLADLARTCGYTAMTLTNVRDELLAAGLCATAAEGRSKPLRFVTRGRALWDEAQPLLRTPVQRTVAAGGIPRGLRVFEAGLTALARDTMLAAPRVATVAADHRALRRGIAKSAVLTTAAPDGDARLVEAWGYDPQRLARGDVVDPLSLWLSLREDPDERVQAALTELLETIPW